MKPAKKSTPKEPAPGISRHYLAAAAVAAVLLIAAVLFVVLNPAVPDEGARFQKAGALYSTSVDLASSGKYQQALDASDRALALNATSLIPLIQANRAGILVMMGDNLNAIAAADASIAAAGNLTNTTSVAWFNKGNALKNLGRISEAKAAYANATALDPKSFPTPGI